MLDSEQIVSYTEVASEKLQEIMKEQGNEEFETKRHAILKNSKGFSCHCSRRVSRLCIYILAS